MARAGNQHRITRRGLFKASAAAGVAAVVVGAAAGCSHSSDEETANPTVVDDDSAEYVIDPDTNESNYESRDLDLAASYEWTIPLGNVLHPGGDSWIPMTTAGSSATPMVKGSALSIASGQVSEVLSEAYTPNGANVVIYDVRCSDQVYAWCELDLLTHAWYLYASAFYDGALSGSVSTLWEGDANYDPPAFVVAGRRVIWQVMPSLSGSRTAESSFCYVWSLGGSQANVAVESAGRFAAEPAVSDGTVTLVPRVRPDEGTFYAPTAYELGDTLSERVDQLVLPETVRPLSAVYMGDSFAFSIEANYDTGGLLGTMGTYIGTSGGPFVALSREPFAPVCGKPGLYIVKSRTSYFVIDTEDKAYSVLASQNRSLDYGDYPACTGTCSNFVTYATIKDQDTGSPTSVSVRVFAL